METTTSLKHGLSMEAWSLKVDALDFARHDLEAMPTKITKVPIRRRQHWI